MILAALSRPWLRPSVVVGQAATLYDGLTPTVYAHPTTSQGTGSGASEANATTLDDALANAGVGEIVGLLPGVATGTETGGDLWEPIYRFNSSGSSGNPKILVGKYDPRYYVGQSAFLSELRNGNADLATASSTGYTNDNRPIAGSYGQDYCQFRNLFVDQLYVPPNPSHGGFVLNLGDNCGFKNIVVACREILFDDDNMNAFFFQASDNVTWENIYAYAAEAMDMVGHNVSVLTTYGCRNQILRSVTFEEINHGIYIKGSASGNTLGNSGEAYYIKSIELKQQQVSVGVVQQAEDPENTFRVHHCLSIRDGQDAGGDSFAFAYEDSGDTGGTSNRNRIFDHLTIIDPSSIAGFADHGVMAEGTLGNDQFIDSVIANTTERTMNMLTLEHASEANIDSDYNLYYNAGGSVRFGRNGSNITSLETWQSTSGLDTNSTVGDPGFTDAGNDDYRRAGADTGSSTGGKRGCYETGSEVIGDGVH